MAVEYRARRWVWRCLVGGMSAILLGLAGCAAQGHSIPANGGIDFVQTQIAAVTPTVNPADAPSTVPLILMGVSVFSGSHTIQIKTGTTVTIQNNVDGGGLHLIYTGANGQFIAQPGAPDALDNPNGVIFQRGQTLTYVFAIPGTYTLTCQYHPSMIVTVIVDP